MAEEKFQVTKEGYDKIVKEHDNLIHVVRNQVIVELQEARAQGDLSENADYDAAREHQAQVEARILELESMIKNAEIIESDKQKSGNIVGLGSVVTILDLSDNTEETYTIVGSIESDPLNGKLSNITPLAVSLMEHKLGDVVEISNVEEPYQVKIVSLQSQSEA